MFFAIAVDCASRSCFDAKIAVSIDDLNLLLCQIST